MGESCSFDLPYVLFVFRLIVILVISHIGFEGGTLVLIASVPGHCLSFTLCTWLKILKTGSLATGSYVLDREVQCPLNVKVGLYLY